MDCSSQSMSDPSLLRGLAPEQQVRLTEILDDYLQLVERGETPNRSDLLGEQELVDPQLHDALNLYLDKLDELYQLAGNQGTIAGSTHCDLRGRRLGDYELIDEIGRGGMGIVYTATDTSLDRTVAIKLLPMAAMLEPVFIERFRAEARAAASLNHPHIVPVYSIGEDSGIHFYAMQRIEGSSLDQRITTHRSADSQPPTNSALKQFANIADALQQAHELGIVHRDIKPSNLILGNDGKLWVADFGLARVQGAEQGLTCSGDRVGTMRYMSPEQATGRSELIDHRTDVYSLGATLYELLSGEAAVLGDEGPALLQKIAQTQPAKLRKLRPDLPRDLFIVIEKAMAKHKDDRYESASQFAADLRCVASGQPIATQLVSPMVVAGRWLAVRPKLVSALFIIGLIATLAISTGTYMVNRMIADAADRTKDSLAKLFTLEQDETIDQLAAIPGAEDIRNRLITRRISYYQEFVARHEGDRQLSGERARAYKRLGRLLEEQGDTPAALECFLNSEALYASLVSIEDVGDGHWLNRIHNVNQLALALSRSSQIEAALKQLQPWLDALRERHSETPLSGGTLLQFGLTENNYGSILQKIEPRNQQIQAAFDQSIVAFKTLIAEDSQNEEAIRGLGVATHNMGTYLAENDQSESASTMFEDALRCQLALAQRTQQPLRASMDLMATYISMGNMHLAGDDTQLARASFEEAAKVGRLLVDVAPRVSSYKRDLAVALCNLGMSSYRSGDSAMARKQLDDSIELYKELLARFPDHPGLQSSLAIAMNNEGIILQHLGRNTDAESAFVEAANLLENAEPLHTSALQNVYTNHARMLRKAGRDEEALRIERRGEKLIALGDDTKNRAWPNQNDVQ
ncbi:MAG: protein kinase domain-containing protein [Aureliella sp.]